MMNLTISAGDVDFVIQQVLDVPKTAAANLTREHTKQKKVKKTHVGSAQYFFALRVLGEEP